MKGKKIDSKMKSH